MGKNQRATLQNHLFCRGGIATAAASTALKSPGTLRKRGSNNPRAAVKIVTQKGRIGSRGGRLNSRQTLLKSVPGRFNLVRAKLSGRKPLREERRRQQVQKGGDFVSGVGKIALKKGIETETSATISRPTTEGGKRGSVRRNGGEPSLLKNEIYEDVSEEGRGNEKKRKEGDERICQARVSGKEKRVINMQEEWSQRAERIKKRRCAHISAEERNRTTWKIGACQASKGHIIYEKTVAVTRAESRVGSTSGYAEKIGGTKVVGGDGGKNVAAGSIPGTQ